MDIVAKLTSKAAGALFAALTGSKEGADVCSTIVEWLVGRAREPGAATIKTISADIAAGLAKTLRQDANQPDLDAILDNAFEAVAAGPTIDEIVERYDSRPERTAAATRAILERRLKAKADRVLEGASILVDVFYRQLLQHPKFTELAEPAFRRVVLTSLRGLEEAVGRLLEGTESLEQLALGLPTETTPLLRRMAAGFLIDRKQTTWAPGDSPLSLLLAANRVIGFERRDDVVEDLQRWCSGETPCDLRLIVGPGGTGKTRLLIETCELMGRRFDWRAGFVRATNELHRETLYRALIDSPQPLLLVFDYAELRVQEVQDLVACVLRRLHEKAEAHGRVRIILLSREAADWWSKTLPARGREVTDFLIGVQRRPDAVQRLAPIAEERTDRETLFNRWRAVFAGRLETKTPEGIPSPWRTILAQPGMDRSLFIALAALAAVTSPEGDRPVTIDDLLRRTIANERGHWTRSLGLELDDPVADAAAAFTLLGGSTDRASAIAIIRTVPSFAGQPHATLGRVFEVLRTLYPHELHRGIGAVQPDLIGEYLVDQRLSEVPETLDSLWQFSDKASVARATLTTLTRMTQSWSRLLPTISDRARETTSRLVDARLMDCIEAAIDVALTTGDPCGQILAAAIRRKDDPALANRALRYSYSHTESGQVDVISLREVNAQAATVMWPVLRATIEREGDEDKGKQATVAFAGFTSNLAVFLSRLNRREDALTAAQEAVGLYRQLAAARRDVFAPNLATSLNNLANRLSDLNRREEALAAAQEVVGLYRQLVTARPNVFALDLAGSLNNLANRLSDLNHREDALAAAQEAVGLYRQLAATRPDVFAPDLAMSLNTLANTLSTLNRREDALTAAQEAVDIRGQLAAARPDVFALDLAGSLNNLANTLSDLNRPEDALTAAQEAVDLYRQLVAARPDVFAPDLAMSLNNLANTLSALNRREDALAAAQEAVGLYRQLAAARPDVFAPDLAMSLNNLANTLSDLNRREVALAAAQEVVGLYRQLAAARPDVFAPDLAMSLNNLANTLSDLNRPEDALTAAQEAVDLYRQLAAARPDVFAPDLARSLGTMGTILLAETRATDARDTFRHGLELILPRLQRLPEAFAQLAAALGQGYFRSCQQASVEPDENLLRSVAEYLPKS